MKRNHIALILSAIFLGGVFFVGWYVRQPASSLRLEEYGFARLNINGTEIKILTNTYSTNRNFVFLDTETGGVVGTLSGENFNIEPPSYRIVKGHSHDWLVITKIVESGTGLMSHTDEWYILGWSHEAKKVLSYESDRTEAPGNGGNNKYWTTAISNEKYLDDSAIDIITTEKSCVPAENGADKKCSESSHTTHYEWDDNAVKFVEKS